MTRLTSAILTMSLFCPLLLAQKPEQSWDNLRQLHPGEKIEVIDMKLKSTKGHFVSFTEQSLSLEATDKPVTLPRSDVYRVTSRERSHRGRNALIGAAWGAGISVALAVLPAGDRRLGQDFPVIFPVGIGLGAGLGATSPGYKTIYRARHRTENAAASSSAKAVPHSAEPLRLAWLPVSRRPVGADSASFANPWTVGPSWESSTPQSTLSQSSDRSSEHGMPSATSPKPPNSSP